MELIFGSLTFWILTGAWLVGTTYNLHKENLFAASAFLVALFVGLYYTGFFNVVRFVLDNPALSLQYLVGYITVGVIWAVVKFKLKMRKIRVKINDRAEEFKNYASSRNSEHPDLHSLKREMNVNDNKENLILWALWFPISMVWTLISDFVTDLLEWLLFDVLGKFLHKIVESEKNKLKV